MIFPEPKDFSGALSPSIRASWIFGIGIFEYPIGRPHPILSHCWSIAHLVVYSLSCYFAQVPRMATKNGSLTIVFIYYITNCFCLTLAIASMIGARNTKTIGIQRRRISSVNRTLNRFGIAEDYGDTFKHQIVGLVVGVLLFIVAIGVSCAVLGVNWNSKNSHSTGFGISVLYRYMLIFVTGCPYCSFFWYVDNRFRHLNAYLIQLSSDLRDPRHSRKDPNYSMSMLLPVTREFYGDRDLRVAKAADQQWMAEVLREARRVHYDLCMAAKEMNQSFGVQINLLVTISFLTITSLLFNIYEIYTIAITTHNALYLSKFIAFSSSWLVIHVMAVYYVVNYSSEVARQARKTGEVIHELVTPNMSGDVHAEIAIFSLQLIQNPLEFTANGLFTLDYVMIRSMAGSVSTYFVIMIQMRSVYGTFEAVETTNIITSLANSTI